MRILHTSDWHIGRTFHGHSTLEALRGVLDAMVAQVREHDVDLVLVAGDVFDSATPAADCYRLLTETLAALRDTGARVVVTSGNHDSAARLGFQAGLLRDGVHVLTDPGAVGQPITVDDADGPVQVYGIPYLEPAIVRSVWPDAGIRSHEQAVGHAMSLVREDLAVRGGRSVVLSHCFTSGVAATPNLERDIQQGGLDIVPVEVFDGVDYVALGHIHGRQELRPNVRYAGAPLHYSFGEAGKERGSWLVDFAADGSVRTTWLALPVPRPLVTITGTMAELLALDATDAWVRARYTDTAPAVDPMRQLQARFPFCAQVEHTPAVVATSSDATYASRVRAARDDLELIDAFLSHVRNGEGATDAERELLREIVGERAAAEALV